MKIISLILFMLISGYSVGYTVIVYGVDNCGYTTDLRNQLTANNIEFSYCDVNTGNCLNDMIRVALDFNLAINGTIYFPVVKIITDKTYGFSRPTVNEIKRIIQNTSSGLIPVGNIIQSENMVEIFNIKGEKLQVNKNLNHLTPGIYILRSKSEVLKISVNKP